MFGYLEIILVCYSPMGRKKKCRNLEIDMDTMICRIFGPLLIDKKKLCVAEKVIIGPDEFQTIIYQDIDGLTMLQ